MQTYARRDRERVEHHLIVGGVHGRRHSRRGFRRDIFAFLSRETPATVAVGCRRRGRAVPRPPRRAERDIRPECSADVLPQQLGRPSVAALDRQRQQPRAVRLDINSATTSQPT